jgi:hypothetical protein
MKRAFEGCPSKFNRLGKPMIANNVVGTPYRRKYFTTASVREWTCSFS